MEAIEWFVIGGIIIGALDEIINRSALRDHTLLQLAMTGLKAIFRVGR
jgi:hypothetical protein